jgi:hypothetical protein
MLTAMAPVAIQSIWSMRIGSPNVSSEQRAAMTTEDRRRGYAMNLNTCHMWDENGQMVSEIEQGLPMEVPLWISKRFKKLGLGDEEWEKMRG